MDIQETKKVWVAWTNTDCTEGRGFVVPKAVCELHATAIRIGKKGSVQGSDCNVTEEVAVRIENRWLVPGRIHYATKEDVEAQKIADDRAEALRRAKAAGLSDEDLRMIAR